MKYYCFVAVFLFSFSQVYSNDLNDYIVTLNNDTVRVQLKSAGLSSFNKKIKAIYQDGNSKIFTPQDIKGYGITTGKGERIYRSKPTETRVAYFLEVVVDGPNAILYEYDVTGGGGQYTMASTHEYYTFENKKGQYLFLTNHSKLELFKTSLTSFYSDNETIQQYIDTKFRRKGSIQKDIRDVVNYVNNN